MPPYARTILFLLAVAAPTIAVAAIVQRYVEQPGIEMGKRAIIILQEGFAHRKVPEREPAFSG
jgi:peptidoglycan/LPS O-acetylase OafA/YrhL